jgi:predicted RNA-binding protein YlqC (UPF0109 family)
VNEYMIRSIFSKKGNTQERVVERKSTITMGKQVPDQDFLEFIIKALVDHPEEVKVERRVDEMGVLLSLKVNPEDMGQIIGREGATARSIRSLVRIIGLKNHARVNLKIEEPEGGRVQRSAPSMGTSEGLDDLKL